MKAVKPPLQRQRGETRKEARMPKVTAGHITVVYSAGSAHKETSQMQTDERKKG